MQSSRVVTPVGATPAGAAIAAVLTTGGVLPGAIHASEDAPLQSFDPREYLEQFGERRPVATAFAARIFGNAARVLSAGSNLLANAAVLAGPKRSAIEEVEVTAQPKSGLRGREIIAELNQGYVTPHVGKKISNITATVKAFKKSGLFLEIPGENSGDPVVGFFVYTSTDPKKISDIRIGASVQFTALVSPFKSRDERDASNLDSPQLGADIDDFKVLSQDNPVSQGIIVGKSGIQLPKKIVSEETLRVMHDDIKTDSLLHEGVPFDPENDAIAAKRVLLNQRLILQNARVVAASDAYGYFYVVPDDGEGIENMTARGGVLRDDDGAEPLMYKIDMSALSPEQRHRVTVGDRIKGDLVGDAEYSFGDYQIRVVENFDVIPGNLEAETTTLVADDEHITIATYNAENFDGTGRVDLIAGQIINNLKSPVVVALQEMAGGPEAFERLIQEIKRQGGPAYKYAQIDPVGGQDGGKPGANIRVGYLVDTARATMKLHGDADAETEGEIVTKNGQPALSHNPVRVAPSDPANRHTRKPLALEVEFNGQKMFFINVHANSKRGDDNPWGSFQPPRLISEAKRTAYTEMVEAFVKRITAEDPDAWVIVLGDANEHHNRKPMQAWNREPLKLATPLLIQGAYTYVYDGYSQDLDQVAATAAPFEKGAMQLMGVHINSEFPAPPRERAGGRTKKSQIHRLQGQVSDHDPYLIRLKVAKPAGAVATQVEEPAAKPKKRRKKS